MHKILPGNSRCRLSNTAVWQCLRQRPAVGRMRCLSSQADRERRAVAIDTERMTTREQRVFDEILRSVVANDPQSSGKDVQKKGDGPRTADPAMTMARQFLHRYSADRRQQQQQQQQQQGRQRSYKKPVEGERAVDRYGESTLAARSALYACETSGALQAFIDSTVLGPFVRGEITLGNISDPAVADYLGAYPLLVAEAMTCLRLAHRDHTAVVTLFRRVKGLGIASQVVGIDGRVYNELLLATFEGWRDLDLVESLLAEMQADGIEPDPHTITMLQHMAQTVLRDREASAGGEVYWATAVRARQLEGLNKTIHQYGKRLPSFTTNQARQGRSAEIYE